jgi:hypothetical protein
MPDGAGTAGADCEPGDGCAAQQLILPPQWQQARTGCWEHAGAGAASNCAHASNKLNRMALNRFTVLFWCDWALFLFGVPPSGGSGEAPRLTA